MNLLSLGTSERRIFAIHDPAAPSAQRPRGVVLCQPVGDEYTYAHRPVRQLALKLAAAGYHVLRFDYFGTGDSGGEDCDANASGCESDIETAMEALADIADTTQVTLIGLRAGANFAANVVRRRPADVEALILWDPILNQGAATSDSPAAGSEAARGAEHVPTPQPADLQTLGATGAPRTAIFVTDDEQAQERARERGFGSQASPATLEHVSAPCPWIESATTTGILPVSVIHRMLEWLR